MKSFFFLFLPLQGLIMGFLKWLAQLKHLPLRLQVVVCEPFRELAGGLGVSVSVVSVVFKGLSNSVLLIYILFYYI